MSKVESAMNNNTNVEELDLNIQKKNDNNFDSSEYDTNDKVVERFKKIKTLIISLVREHEFLLKIYKKNCDQEVKKMSGKKKKKNTNSENVSEQKKSGFTKPTLVPKRVALFLDLPEDAVIPRTNVTKLIYSYIKDNNLQEVEDKKISHCDEKLSKLFDIPLNSEIKFSTFQTLLSKVYNSEKLENEQLLQQNSNVSTVPVVTTKVEKVEKVEEVEEVKAEEKVEKKNEKKSKKN